VSFPNTAERSVANAQHTRYSKQNACIHVNTWN